jgi:hypothetical protein
MSNKEIVEIKAKLEELEGRIYRLEETPTATRNKKASIEAKPDHLIERLAQKIGVDPEGIKKIFDIEGESLTLVSIFGKDDKERTKNATLLILIGYKYLFGRDDVLSQEVRRNVAENRVPLNNFSEHLNRITPSLIRRKGKTRSPKTTYRLTSLGEAEARELLRQSVNRE